MNWSQSWSRWPVVLVAVLLSLAAEMVACGKSAVTIPNDWSVYRNTTWSIRYPPKMFLDELSPCSVVISDGPFVFGDKPKPCSALPFVAWSPPFYSSQIHVVVEFALQDPNALQPADRLTEVSPPLSSHAVADDYGSLNVRIGDQHYRLTLFLGEESTDSDRHTIETIVASIRGAPRAPYPTRPPLNVQPPVKGTALPFQSFWDMVVDRTHHRVFVSGGPGTTSLAVYDYAGDLVQTIPISGAAGMELVGHALFVEASGTSDISTIDTNATPLQVSGSFHVVGLTLPYDLTYVGGRLWFVSTWWGWGTPSLVWATTDGSEEPRGTIDSPEPPHMGGGERFVKNQSTGRTLYLLDPRNQSMRLRTYEVTPTGRLVNAGLTPSVGADQSRGFDAILMPDGKSILIAADPPSPGATEGFRQVGLDGRLIRQYVADVTPDAVDVTMAKGGMVAGGTSDWGGLDVWAYRLGSSEPFWSYDFGSSNFSTLNGGIAWSDDGRSIFVVAGPLHGSKTIAPRFFVLHPNP